ncbi:UNVERIFIED_CONTAM: hypothetical protein GTU68_009983 [Idotea baltica]|nr:hypothetical protein [Idotea baltica]
MKEIIRGIQPPVWYSVLFALGFIISYQFVVHFFKKEGKDPQNVDTLTVYMVLATIVGARLGHLLFYEPERFLADPLMFFRTWEGGLASHGGAFGILFAIWTKIKRQGQSYLWILDRIVIVTAMTAAFIRFGNFVNSEIVGLPTESDYGVVFGRIAELPRHPAQLYEAGTSIVLFLILLLIWMRYKEKTPEGLLFGLFLVILFGLRFFHETFKENQEAFEDGLPLNMGQILSIPLIAVGLGMLARVAMKSKKQS